MIYAIKAKTAFSLKRLDFLNPSSRTDLYLKKMEVYRKM